MTTIELDIFSGRPNPAWTLTSDEGAALARLVANLPPAAAPADVALGYRGFIVTEDSTVGGAGGMRVFAGTVAVGGRHFKDVHGAERWLFDNARSHGHGQLVDAVAPR